jgi:beta-ribofuranosylaminobenzene 5'-phosphate synthase
LEFRTYFPVSWPVLIVLERQVTAPGVYGDEEVTAFENLPTTPNEIRQAMIERVRDEMIPGLMQRNYGKFSEAVYQFGRQSGMFFTSLQHGEYHSESVAELIEFVRNTPTKAVSQSSWGPGVFAISETEEESSRLIDTIRTRYEDRFEIIQTVADNSGVSVVYP